MIKQDKKLITISIIIIFMVALHLVGFKYYNFLPPIFQIVVNILSGLYLIIPAIFPILLIFKLTKGLSDKKRFYINMLSIAFFIPFSNLCISIFPIRYSDFNFWQLACFLGFDWLFIILPISFIVVVLIPSKLFKHKKFTLLTILCTTIIGWSLVFASAPLAGKVIDITRHFGLKDYSSTIRYIENYKDKNGVYPKELNIKIKLIRVFPYYEYKTFDNELDFRLKVSGDKHFHDNYNYCSSPKITGCSEYSRQSGYNNYNVSKWVGEVFDID